jgi:ParB-like chromosome segregation protein Spo0J
MTDPEVRTLEVTAIQTDPDINPRVWLNPSAVETYSALYREHEGDDAPLPLLDVFWIDHAYYVADGHHRLAAAQKASLATLQCRVFRGTRQEAFLHAVRANAGRGVPFHYGDYERIVTRMLTHPDTAALSNREIARRIGCSHTYVNHLRPRLERQATVEQALSRVETVSTHAKSPKTIARQQVAALLDLPLETVKTYEQQCVSLKDTLMHVVGQGTPLAQATATLRQEVQRRTAPRRGGLRPVQVDATARAHASSEAPQVPPPTPTASGWAEQVATAVLRQAGFLPEASGAVPEPPSLADHLRMALLAELHLLEAGTAAEVVMALKIARERVERTMQTFIEAARGCLSALQSIPDAVVVCQVVEALEGQRLSQPPATARAIGHMVRQLQAWIENSAPGTTTHPARRTAAL